MEMREFSPNNILNAIRNPSLLLDYFERIVSKYTFRYKYGRGVDVINRDWDNLIILDACRADFFDQYNDIEGEFETVVSKGSHSKEFIKKNFAGRDLHDTILVTANPFVELLDEDVFFRVCYAEVFEHWDDELKTIPPERVVDVALAIHEQHPDKRLIVHFMQPHAPYIGPTGKKLAAEQDFGVINPHLDGFDTPDVGIALAVKEGYIEENELVAAYLENLNIVLEQANRLVDGLGGKSVITADHGELLGERVIFKKRYAHPTDFYAYELRVVPWFVINSDERREVTREDPKGFDTLDEAVRKSHLEALGYT